MAIALELGLKEGQRRTWRSWGLSIIRDMGLVRFGVYLVLPLAIHLKLLFTRRDPYPYLLGEPLTKWCWLDIDFRCYKFIYLKIGLPLWRG